MYILLVVTFPFLLTCHCLTLKDEGNLNICGIGRRWLWSIMVSTEFTGKGFHRELVTTVKFSPDVPNVVNLLLVHKLPRGLYVDPYQLASLSGDSHLQILLNSAIDLEAPAHRTRGFVALVYCARVGPSSKLVKTSIPVHCRYHEPSFGDHKAAYVNIGPPDLLLRGETCTDGGDLTPYSIVDAPCTASNSSTCSWVQIPSHQGQSHVSLQIPVGDGSLRIPVICVTLLVTVICCWALSVSIWKQVFLTQ